MKKLALSGGAAKVGASKEDQAWLAEIMSRVGNMFPPGFM